MALHLAREGVVSIDICRSDTPSSRASALLQWISAAIMIFGERKICGSELAKADARPLDIQWMYQPLRARWSAIPVAPTDFALRISHR